MQLLEEEVSVKDYLSTGSTLLNMAISCNKSKLGGIPVGRITEFSGTGASGKTFICGEICGDAISKDFLVFVDDIERRWDLSRLDTFGGIIVKDKKTGIYSTHENFHYFETPSVAVEGCFERMFETLDKHKDQKILYIVDPIAALYAAQELKSDKMGQSRAKALQKYFRFLKGRISSPDREPVSIVFSNQLIDAVGQMFGPKKRTPGGNAMVHWPSVRVRFSSLGKLIEKRQGRKDEFKKTTGIKLHADVSKNSEDDPFRVADFSIVFGYGIDDIKDNVFWLKSHTDVLGKTDSWYELPKSTEKAKGLDNFVRLVEDTDSEDVIASATRRHYRRWNATSERKPKTR